IAPGAAGRRSYGDRAVEPGRSQGVLRPHLVRAQRGGGLPPRGASVKVRVLIRLKPGIMDVQGAAVQRALGGLGFADAHGRRAGIVVGAAARAEARARAEWRGRRLRANTILADYASEV